jgi:TM2 domain-containing membrane protein YozV
MENEVTQIPNTNPDVSPKSRLVALLLAIFLGGFGAHQFYLGKIGRGVAHVVLYVAGLSMYIAGLVTLTLKAAEDDFSIGAVVTLVLGLVFLLIPGIWSFVSWIIIAVGKAKDSNGLILRNWMD